ncbi:MAG: LPS-assembly protein LptD [Chromatiales bacterium]
MRHAITTIRIALALLTTLSPPAYGRGERVDINWGLCPVEPEGAAKPSSVDLDPGFASLEGDEATLIQNGTSVFSGNVELVRDDHTLRTDRLTYDEPNAVVDARGHTRLWSGSLFWEGEHANVDLGQDRGILENGSYRLLDRHGRGEAAYVEHDMNKDLSKLREVTYTTCPGETPAWKLSARKLFLDHREEWGSARDVVLRVKGVPVGYTPYISFPLSDRRKSGLLPPTFGGSRDSGFDITLPYYWNIAPNYDATFFPRALGSRGLMLGGEYRYLLPTLGGEVVGNYLPNDSRFNHEDRWLVQFRHNQGFDENRGRLGVDFNNVSDDEYLEDFGNSLALSSTRFLNRNAYVTHGRDWWSVHGRVNSYQSVDPTLPGANRPYDYLPQVFYRTNFRRLTRHVNFQVHGETTYFDREASVTGGRFDLKPFVSFPFETPGSFLIPKVTLEQTWYALDGDTAGGDQPSRTVPALSVDSGLYLERPLSLGGAVLLHTIEPRLFYLYRPEVEQDDIPIFDTNEYDFSFSQLFRENRFASIDRLGDANSLTLAVTSRLLEETTGLERLRLSVGQIYHLADREVVLPGQRKIDDPVSEIVAEAYAELTPAWSIGGTLQWDPNDNETDKSAVRLRYRPGDNKIVNFDYRFRSPVNVSRNSTSIEQTDFSFRWPLSDNWSMLGRWNYSLPDNQTLETVAGIEYESCCWGVRLVGRRFISTSEGAYDNALMMQIVLKGLGGIGSVSSYLKKNIPGYTNEF